MSERRITVDLQALKFDYVSQLQSRIINFSNIEDDKDSIDVIVDADDLTEQRKSLQISSTRKYFDSKFEGFLTFHSQLLTHQLFSIRNFALRFRAEVSETIPLRFPELVNLEDKKCTNLFSINSQQIKSQKSFPSTTEINKQENSKLLFF